MEIGALNQGDDLKNEVLRSIAWLGGLKYLGQLISWGITIIVIRILSPGDYGLIAMASVCINLLLMLSELGLGAAIIQQKEISQRQLGQVFGFIIISHVTLFIILFFGAHFIASYFSEPRLVRILQTMSVSFIFLAFYVIPQSMLIRKMEFQKKSIVDLISTVSCSLITLVLVIQGFGVWSLVWGAIFIHIFNVCGYNLVSPILLIPNFKIRGVEKILSFGGYTLGFRILWFFYSRCDVIIGGRLLGNKIIGTYAVALELSSIPLEKFLPVINQVAFPAYSNIQSSMDLVRSHFLKAIRIISLILFPVFWGFIIVAPELIGWLLGSKWTEVILPVQLLCIIMPFRALGTLFSPMLNGVGRPDVNFLYIAIASVLMPIAFFIGVKYNGITGICLAWIFGYMIIFIISLKLSLRTIQLSIVDFLANSFIAPLASVTMMCILFGIKRLIGLALPSLVVGCLLVVAGMVTYVSFLYIFKKETITEMLSLIPGKRKLGFINLPLIFNGRRT